MWPLPETPAAEGRANDRAQTVAAAGRTLGGPRAGLGPGAGVVPEVVCRRAWDQARAVAPKVRR
jgi:hypothetical protein